MIWIGQADSQYVAYVREEKRACVMTQFLHVSFFRFSAHYIQKRLLSERMRRTCHTCYSAPSELRCKTLLLYAKKRSWFSKEKWCYFSVKNAWLEGFIISYLKESGHISTLHSSVYSYQHFCSHIHTRNIQVFSNLQKCWRTTLLCLHQSCRHSTKSGMLSSNRRSVAVFFRHTTV